MICMNDKDQKSFEYRNTLKTKLSYRKQLLQKVTEQINLSSGLPSISTFPDWSLLGSIERQCDIFERLLAELAKTKDTNT